MTLKELEKQLLALTPGEKTQAIQLLVQSLSNTWQGIEKTTGVCGGDARIANTRIPIWSLVNYRLLGANDMRILQDFPHLSAADLANAWAYAEAHPEEIEAAIARNNEELLKEAFRLTNFKTEKELIDFALQELVRNRTKRNLLDLSGQIQFAPDYDYKALRENRNVSD